MDRHPLVSVVIPTFNRAQLILDALRSIASQAGGHALDVVVVDDGSTDDTSERVMNFDPSIRLLRQNRRRRGAARNLGIREARGSFIAFLDDDDLYEPWHIEQFYTSLEANPEGRLFGSPVKLWNPRTNEMRKIPTPKPGKRSIAHEALLGTVLPPQAIIVHKDTALELGGFPESLEVDGSEDFVFLARVAAHVPLIMSGVESVRIREHPGRGMHDTDYIIESRRAAMELLLADGLGGRPLDQKERRFLIGGTHRFCAALYYETGRLGEARAEVRDAFRTFGWRYSHIAAGIWLRILVWSKLSSFGDTGKS